MALVRIATLADLPAWRDLAAEVEPLFGPMVGEPGFEDTLRKNVDRGSAFCVRQGDGPPGAPLTGGLLWSARRSVVNWLAVAATHRRQGVGSALVRQALDLAPHPSEVTVTTFAGNSAAARAAQAFYRRHGFRPAERVPSGPDGRPRQVLRLRLPG